MDFKDYLVEEEKKVEKVAICFVTDADEKEVYTVLAGKVVADPIITGHERYAFVAGSQAVKLANKGWKSMLFDLNGLKKHVAVELEDDAKKKAAGPKE